MEHIFGYILLWAAFILLAVLSSLVAYRKTSGRFLLIAGIVLFGGSLLLFGQYLYDVYVLPHAGWRDGVPVTAVMRLFSMGDDFGIKPGLVGQGVVSAMVLNVGTLIFMAFSIVAFRGFRIKKRAG